MWGYILAVAASASLGDGSVQEALPGCPDIEHVDLKEQGAESRLHELFRRRGSDAKPFVVRGLDSFVETADSNWSRTWRQGAMSWTSETLTGRYGDERYPVRDVDGSLFAQFSNRDVPKPGAQANSGKPRSHTTLRMEDFLQSLSGNSSMGQIFLIGKQLPSNITTDFPLAEFVTDTPEHFNPVLSLGNEKHAVAFHNHGSAWLVTLRGKKRWFLLPPGSSPWNMDRRYLASPLLWGEEAVAQNVTRGENSPFICDVERGQGMWVPIGWWHATQNIGQTFAAGHQMSVGKLSNKEINTLLAAYPNESAFIWLAHQRAKKDADIDMLMRKAVKYEPYNFLFLESLLDSQIATAADMFADGHRREGLRILQEVRKAVKKMVRTLTTLRSENSLSTSEVAYMLQRAAVVLFQTPSLLTPELQDLYLLGDALELLHLAEEMTPEDLRLLDRLAHLSCEVEPEESCKTVLHKILDLEPSHKRALEALRALDEEL